jgi:methyl-CpG-binding domain protein 4
VRRVVWRLFKLCPTPEAALAADVARIEAIIQPLGLFRKRALSIRRLSHEYLHSQWRHPTELHGIGKYASDAYFIFCRGDWAGVAPEDKDLARYRTWLAATGGLGTGHAHDPAPVMAESDGLAG